jgi:diguanylate cyclase (GGDEF)-like protein
LKIISLTLVIHGIILLAFSLFPTRDICNRKEKLSKGWKFLAILIGFFIGGYFLFGHMLAYGSPSFLKLIVSIILFGGGIFVILVVRLSKKSIIKIEAMAAKERHRALHDDLTELPNRALFEERLDYAILQAKRRGENFILFILDLVRFKEVNDSLGHSYGDYVLQEVSSRLLELVRDSDTLARVGGDEFALLLPGTEMESAIKICHKVSLSLDEPFVIEGHRFNVGVSIGVAAYPDHGSDSETLLHQADTAMYEAKKNDVIYAIFHPSQDRASLDRLILISELREAIAKNHLVLHYQPKVSPKDMKLTGVEALVRWQHPEKGLIQPDEFIPLVEQAGLSKHLTHWVLDNAMEQCVLWKKDNISVTISVNLSIKNLHDFDFPNDLAMLLDKWNVDPEMILLEVTESCMVVAPERVNKVVCKLKEMGFHLSIDDFGTGYSSLSYLRKFPAREIKIDKSFVMDMNSNEDNAVIVRSTIEMVHNIGFTVVAEGVEDKETCQLLADLGCDNIQGFHICRPLPAAKLQKWFDSL